MAYSVLSKICIALLLLSHSLYAACSVTDDTGKSIATNKPARRIVSLAPDLTEILFVIDGGERVIGVVGGSDYPSRARSIIQIGSYSGIDLERIIALRPDLIVTWSKTFSRQLAVLEKFGIPIYTTQPRRLEDIPRTMKNLGCLTGLEKVANQEANKFSHRLTTLRQHYHTQKPVTVFYQIGSYSLITINKDSWINQVIELCGGHNVFAGAKFIAPEVSWEAVVAANPQVIISDAKDDNWKKNWEAWSEISAVKNHLLFKVNPDLLDRAGPRLVDGAELICRDLQVARGSPAR